MHALQHLTGGPGEALGVFESPLAWEGGSSGLCLAVKAFSCPASAYPPLALNAPAKRSLSPCTLAGLKLVQADPGPVDGYEQFAAHSLLQLDDLHCNGTLAAGRCLLPVTVQVSLLGGGAG